MKQAVLDSGDGSGNLIRVGGVGGDGVGEPTAKKGERFLEIRAPVGKIGVEGGRSEEVFFGGEGVGEEAEERRGEIGRAGQREGGPFHLDPELSTSSILGLGFGGKDRRRKMKVSLDRILICGI